MKLDLYGNPGNAKIITRVDTIINPDGVGAPTAKFTATGDPDTGLVTSSIWTE
jgi:hypothetical protein